MEKVYYVYEHIRLDTNDVFYIGIGTKKVNAIYNCKIYQRAYFKAKSKRSEFWYNIYNKCNKKIKINIVYESNNLNFIKNKEIELIKKYGKRIDNSGTLVNISDGGDGAYGVKWSDEAKEIKRNNMIGNKNHFYNKKHTDETKKILSDINKGKHIGDKNHFYNKKHTDETKRKLSDIGKKRWINGTLPKLPIMKGSNNPSAKKIIAINHNTDTKYLIHGEIIYFCEEFNLSHSIYKKYVNKGIYKTSPSVYLKNKKTEKQKIH